MSYLMKISGKTHALDSAGAQWRFEQRPGGWVVAEKLEGGHVVRRVLLSLSEARGRLSASVGGVLWQGEITQSAGANSRGASGRGADSDLIAQFPGKVRKILVTAGSKVGAGDPLVLVEAMKMEFSIKAPSDGKVTRVLVTEGQQLAPGTRFLDFEAEDASKK